MAERVAHFSRANAGAKWVYRGNTRQGPSKRDLQKACGNAWKCSECEPSAKFRVVVHRGRSLLSELEASQNNRAGVDVLIHKLTRFQFHHEHSPNPTTQL